MTDTTPPKKFPPLVTIGDKVLFEPINQPQYDYITSQAPNLWFWGNRGGGKAVRLATVVPTPTGYTTMADLRVGDVVFDEHGQPCRVTGKSAPHIDPWGTWRVRFDDGSDIVCGGHHEWWTLTKVERTRQRRQTAAWREHRRQQRASRATVRAPYRRTLQAVPDDGGGVRTTRDIAATLTYTTGTYTQTNHAVPVAGAWQMPPQAVPVPPYVLGAWLGDGTTRCGQITSADIEVIERIEAAGYDVDVVPSSGTLRSVALTWNIRGVMPQLRAAGVLGDKHIPAAYLCGSIDQRLDLLRGLMDTDGYTAEDGQAVFTNTNARLARGVYALAASLGVKPHWRESRATLHGEDCGPCYDVAWTAALDVFTVPRKRARLPHATRSTTTYRFIIGVERVPDELVACIEVDSPSHLYLVGEVGIPTHNSVTARWTCHARALAHPGYRYAILRTSFPELIKNHLIYLSAEMKAIRGDDKGYNASKFICTYPNGSMGFFMQAETDEQTRNALGIELMEVVFDEAPTFKWDHMMMIASSVRVPVGSGLLPLKRFNGNPIGNSIDEIWKYFIDKDVDPDEEPEYQPDEWQSIYIDMRDNVRLDVAAYTKQLGSGLSPHLRKAWLLGERVEPHQLFEIRPTVKVEVVNQTANTIDTIEQPYHIITELPQFPDSEGRLTSVLEQPWVRFHGGYDDGFIDPAVMVWCVVVGSQVIVFNERVWTHTNSVDIAKQALDASVILRADGTPLQLPVSTIYADPTIAKQTTAVQSTQEVMEAVWKCLQHGTGTKRCCGKARALTFEPSTNSRELYASAIHRMLQAEVGPNVPRLQFLRPDVGTPAGRDLVSRGIVGCPYLLKALPKMVFDEHNPQKMAPHKHDHPVCALAYYAMSYPTTTAPATSAMMRPAWWGEFFVGNSNVPKRQGR